MKKLYLFEEERLKQLIESSVQVGVDEAISKLLTSKDKSTDQPNKLYSVKEAAEYFGVTRQTISAWVTKARLGKDGGIRRVGGRLFFSEECLRNAGRELRLKGRR